jgi:hypothetical protein
MRQMQLVEVRLQFQPYRLPLLRSGFHCHLFHTTLPYPGHQMFPLASAAPEFADQTPSRPSTHPERILSLPFLASVMLPGARTFSSRLAGHRPMGAPLRPLLGDVLILLSRARQQGVFWDFCHGLRRGAAGWARPLDECDRLRSASDGPSV